MTVSPTARVSELARLGDDVDIGDFTVVGPEVELGDGCVVESHCLIGHETPLARGPLRIADGALIRSHSVLYAGSRFGPGLTTGHRVTVREGIDAGPGLQIGTLCDLQGETRFGDHVRLHSSVHVGQRSTIGSFVWLFPYVVLTNDRRPPSEGPYVGPTIEDYAVVSTGALVFPGIHIGPHALVGAGALVTRDVAPGTVVAGAPARERGRAADIAPDADGAVAPYPWPAHFRRGYPAEVGARWDREYPV